MRVWTQELNTHTTHWRYVMHKRCDDCSSKGNMDYCYWCELVWYVYGDNPNKEEHDECNEDS